MNQSVLQTLFFSTPRLPLPRHPAPTSGSLGTMGVGLPFAIGAQFAFPNHTSILIDGDGSFNMTSSELYSINAQA